MARNNKGLDPNQPLKHANHRRPITRREFIQQGFMTGGAIAAGPTVLGLFSNPAQAALSTDINNLLSTQCGGGSITNKIPFICFDLAGGANIAGSNVLVGKQGGQKDFLSTAGYSKLGIPGDMIPPILNTTNDPATSDFINEDLGLAFHSDSGFLKGIMDSISLTTAANTNGAVIPARSDNDTANNPHNPMYGIVKAGQQGELLDLIGSRSSLSGGNSIAPMSLLELAYPRPTKIDRPTDSTGLVDTGKLVGLFQPEESVYVMEAIQRLSDKKLKNINTKLTNDAIIKEMVSCGYVKSADLVDRYGSPSTLDPELDADITDFGGVTGSLPPIFPSAIWDGPDRNEFKKTGSIMKLVINGYAGAGTVTMGGFDYHTGDRITGELRDYRAGRCIGACLEYAARRKLPNGDPDPTPVMIYVFSDGSVSSNGSVDPSTDANGIYNGNKGEWTSDNSGTAASFILVYNPTGRPQLFTSGSDGNPAELHQQIGYFSSDASVVTSSSLCANNVNLLVNTVLLNYMALNGEIGNFTTAFSNHGLGNAASIDSLIAFEAL